MEKMLTTEEVADITGYSVGTLNNLRVKGGGPQYVQRVKRGRVMYKPEAVREWQERNTRKDTTESEAV